MPALEVRGLHAGYGRLSVLKGIDISLEASAIGLVLGPNGAGKTTLLRAISGLCTVTAGSVLVDGASVVGRPPHQLPGLGITHVPEGRQLFRDMTVFENLDLGMQSREARAYRHTSFEYVYELFPVLKARSHQRAGTLSGGEQQMLAIGRALMVRPRLLLLDEPSTGLAPVVLVSVLAALMKVAANGTAILMVEQIVPRQLPSSGPTYIVRDGAIVAAGRADELLGDGSLGQHYFGKGAAAESAKHPGGHAK
jgi:branched-chain amino acid transport system ATP-binding protein